MFKTLWNAILLKPIYNIFVLLIIVFSGNAGLAIVGLTIVIKLILLPFTAKTIKSQVAMKAIEPQLQKIREEHATDKQLQTKKTFELYKEHKVNPFTSCLLLLVQLPVLIALYRAIGGAGTGTGAAQVDFIVHSDLIYKFIHFPEHVSKMFLGLDITQKHNIILAILVAGLQFFQAWFTQKNLTPNTSTLSVAPSTGAKQPGADMQKMMMKQMMYVMPVVIGFVVYGLPVALGIYWAVNIIITIIQEYYIRNKYMKIYERRN